MKNIKKMGKKGVSLVELMAAMVILSLIMTPISYMLYVSYNTFYQENDRMKALQQGNDAMELIINDLRKYENQYTSVDVTNEILTIKDNVHYPGSAIEYSYNSGQQRIDKNGSTVFTGNDVVVVESFTVTQTDGGRFKFINYKYGRKGWE